MRRYGAKAAERRVSVRTVKRWVAASREEREAALAGEMPAREAGSGGLGRADPRWAEMALEIMGEHKDESTPGKAKIIQSIGPRLAARYPGEEIRLLKRSAAYGWLAELERRQPTFGVSGKRRRDIAGRPVAAYGKLRPTRPGEYLLMDTIRLDVFALDQLTFRWVQPELSVAMDWYSRCITGLRVTPVSTKSVDIAATLFQAYRPRPAGADWPAHAAWPDHGIPRGIVLDRDAIEGPMADAARKAGGASPALVPETLVVDHGKVYVSEHITSVCQRMGSSIQPARLRTGRDKGPVRLETTGALARARRHAIPSTFCPGWTITSTLQRLHATPQWRDICTALTMLAGHLDAQPPAIDYERRRHLDYTSLLPDPEWEDIRLRTERADHLQLSRRHALYARHVLFTRLSGLPFTRAPFSRSGDGHAFKTRLAAFITSLTPELAAELNCVAEEFLGRRQIRAEPADWQPPTWLLDGLDLPGPDLASLELNEIHKLARTDGASVAAIARRLGTTSDAIQAILLDHPAPADPAGGARRRRARYAISREQFGNRGPGRQAVNAFRWSAAQVAKARGGRPSTRFT